MQNFKKIISLTPLSTLVIGSMLVMAIVGLYGRFSFLKKFDVIDNVKQPFFTISLYGIKDYINADEDVYVPDALQSAAAIRAREEALEKAAREARKKLATLQITNQIPDASCNPVCGAIDYGVANRELMVDDSFVFNTDTEGLFAPNGTYKTLKKTESDDYFKDALFIGDSRTVGLYLFSNMQHKVNFFCKESMNVFNLPVKELQYHGIDGEESTCLLDDLLDTHQYGKIYVCLGINEMYRNSLDYYKAYRNIIENIHKKQPDAVIFIESSMHVSALKSSSDATFNNTSLVQRNKAISQLANGRNIFYIDMNPAVCDANGDLIADYTTDGVHLKANYYKLWADFLRENVIY